MKRVIAFVFLGIMIYAGIYILIFGIAEYRVSLCEPITFGQPMRDGLVIQDTINKKYQKLGQKTTQSKLFGVPISDPVTTYFYVISYSEHPYYLLLAVSDPEDVRAVEELRPGGKFSFTGVLKEMDHGTLATVQGFLKDHPSMINADNMLYNLEAITKNYISEFVIYVGEVGEPDPTPIIVGAAVILVGAGLAALLIIKIVREKTGY